jgi:hypothetical protein
METRETTKSPDTEKLEEIIEKLEEGTDLTDDDLDVTTAALKWTCNFLIDRRLYHKQKQARDRAFEKLAKKMLSKDEVAAIEAKVKGLTEAELLGKKGDE